MKVDELIKLLQESDNKLINNKCIRKIIIVDGETKYAIQFYFKGLIDSTPLTIFKDKDEINGNNNSSTNNDISENV